MLLITRKGESKFQYKWLALWIYLACVAGNYLHSTLVMGYCHRFVYHLSPIILMVLARIFSNRELKKDIDWIVCPILSVILAFSLYVSHREFINYTDKSRHSIENNVRVCEAIKKYINKNDVVALSEAGIIPYMLDKLNCQVIDFGGLNDNYLARNQLTDKMKIHYILDKSPEVILACGGNQKSVWYTNLIDQISGDYYKAEVISDKYRDDVILYLRNAALD